jgi:tetratricopeptide (TPR) repeat protein
MADREVFESSQYGEGPSRLFPDLPQSAALNDDNIRKIRERIEEAEQRKDFGACLTLCCEAIKMEPADLNEFLIMKSMYLVRVNRSDEANETLAPILVNDPENAKALAALGFIFYHQGNLKKSMEVFTNALQIDSGLKNARHLKKNSKRLIEIFNASECNRMSLASSHR